MAEQTPEQKLKSLQDQKKLATELLAEAEKLGKAESEILELKLKVKEADREVLNTLFEQGKMSAELAAKNLSRSQEKTKELEKQREVLNQQTEELKRQEALQNKLGQSIESLANKWRGGFVEGILEAGVNFKQLGESIKKSVTLTNLAGTAMSTMVQSTLMTATMFDQAQSSFAAATGAGRTYSDVIMEVSRGSSMMGVGVQESARAVGDLYNGMSLFDSQSKSTQAELARTTAELERLGISGATSASNFEFSMRVMGQSGDEAAASAENMAKFAMGIGIAPAKMAEEFKQAGPKLAAYGKNATKVFEGLARQSKKTGIEMGSLLSLTEQFDTFEGAANAAGQLNSILGGPYLDSVKMLTMSEDERVQAMQDAITMSGKSFDSMSKFEKKALANSLGITDMAEANKMFSESSRLAAAAQEEQSISAEDLAARQAATVSVQEKLNMLMQSFAVLVEPIVNGISSVVETFMGWNDATNGYLFPTLTGLTILTYGVVKGFKIFGKAAEDSSEKIGKSLSKGLTKLGKGVGKLGMGLTKTIPFMLSFGATTLMVGAGVALVGLGFKLAFDSLVNLLPVLTENSGAFMDLGIGIGVLAAALFGLSFVGLGGVLVLAGIAGAAYLLGKALGTILDPVTEVSSSIGMMFEQINALREGSAFKNFVDVVAQVDTAAVDNLEALMDQADRMVTIQAKLSALEATQSIGNAIDKLISFVAPDASGASEERKREIILQLNNREFGRAVVEALDNDMKLSLA